MKLVKIKHRETGKFLTHLGGAYYYTKEGHVFNYEFVPQLLYDMLIDEDTVEIIECKTFKDVFGVDINDAED